MGGCFPVVGPPSLRRKNASAHYLKALGVLRHRTNEVGGENRKSQRLQSIVTTSRAVEMPLTVTSRGSDVANPDGTVARLATISSGPASDAIREAS
jgi:hypothetical protein